MATNIMQIRDFWLDLKPAFDGKAQEIQEIDFTHLSPEAMTACLSYILTNARESTTKFQIKGTETQVLLPSPHAVVQYILQGQVTMAMWLSLPSIPLLSVYIDFPDEISFGYVRGAWNAMSVIAFFDFLYELKTMSPTSQVRPSIYTFSNKEREAILSFWQAYDDTSS